MGHVNRIDVIFTQKFNGKCCKDCKVILRENVATQYRLVVLDIFVIIIIIIMAEVETVRVQLTSWV